MKARLLKLFTSATLMVMVFTCLLVPAGVVHAQVQTGSIIGALRDESQAAVPGVTATLTSPALPAGPSTVVTDETGQYRFRDLVPGIYTLTLTLAGFSTYVEEGLRVAVGGTTQRDVVLKVGELAETVTVSGESPIVDTREAAVVSRVTKEAIEAIPVDRYGIHDYEQWIPGVAINNLQLAVGSHSTLVMGSPNYETSHMLDGAQTNNPTTGQNLMIGDPDAVEEIQGVTLGASAEYQIAQGGVFNAVVKSGTNQFTFAAKSFSSPDALTNKPFKLPCKCPLGETGFTNVQTYDWSVHGGGPIVRNRAWFFGGYGYWTATQSQPGGIPTQAAGDDVDRMVAKITWQINNRLRFSGTYHNDLWTFGFPPTPATPYETITKSSGSIPVYAAEVTAPLSKSTLVTVRASGWYFPLNQSKPLSGDFITPQHLDRGTGIASRGVASTNRVTGGRHALAFKVNRLARVGRIDHDIRFGGMWERADATVLETRPSGVQYFDIGGVPDEADFADASVSGAAFNTLGGWGEDQVTLGRVTVTLGLRVDRMHAVSLDLPAVDAQFRETGTTIKGLGDMFTWSKTWSPRVGFNVRLTGDAKTILRGTYGRYYRAIFLDDFRAVHPGIPRVTRAKFDPATGGYTTILSVTDPRANLAVDSKMAAPWTDQYSIGVDRELIRNMAVTVSYVYKFGKNQVGWKDIGGVYGERTDVLPNGQTLTVYPLLNHPSQRLFLRTNGPGYYGRYHGLILSLAKRLSQRWQADLSYTLSKAEGIQVRGYGASPLFGQDPNDLINFDGRLPPQDRPHMVTARASYVIPRVDMTVSTAITDFSGIPFAPQALVSLPQGGRLINIAPPGSYRTARVHTVNVSFDKILVRGGGRQLSLTGTLFNVLQDQTWQEFITSNFFSPNFGKPAKWGPARYLTIGARAQF